MKGSMSKVIKLHPGDSSCHVVDLDASLLVFAPMGEVRCRVEAGIQCASDPQLFVRVLRTVAQMLIEDMIAPRGKRTERFGLHAHNAGRRAVDLLVLADEIDASGEARRDI